jgi:hypothetical protein
VLGIGAYAHALDNPRRGAQAMAAALELKRICERPAERSRAC